MAGKRIVLHSMLLDIVDNVYFQPPPTAVLKTPCIKYERSKMDKTPADNITYRLMNRYTLTVIDACPDSPIPDRLIKIPYCNHSSHYATGGLNYDIFDLYY